MENYVFIVNCERISRRSFYYVSFLPNDQLTNRIKELDENDRKWNSGFKCWEISTRGLYLTIKKYRGSNKIKFDFGSDEGRRQFALQIQKIEEEEKEKQRRLNELIENKKKWVEFKNDLDNNYHKYIDLVHKNLKPDVRLYPHQVTATMFTNMVKNVLISHQMGLGKTAASIAYSEMNDYNKIFVITPNSLKFNFYNEINKFTNSKAHIINWKKNKYTIEESKYVIVNYEFFSPSDKRKFADKWKKLKIKDIDVLILDECQLIKNTKSNTYRNFKSTFKKSIFKNSVESKVFLSGTPAPNRAYELYSVLNQISPDDFKTKKYFYEYYCGMTYDGVWGWNVDINETKFEELFNKIAPYTHRKRKEEVLTDLPEKTYQKVLLEFDNNENKIYSQIEEGVANEFIDSIPKNPLTVMLRLRQFTSSIKVKHVKDIIDNILETGEKIVIVDNFKESLIEIKRIYGDIVGLHTGEVELEERAKIVEEFQDPKGKIKIFAGTIQTCNYGLTLTASSVMFILTQPFSVGQYDQVSDRIHRIGQKNSVNIYPIIFTNSIDEYVYDIIETKRVELSKVIDNINYVDNTDESVVYDVILRLKNKYKKD